MQVIVDLSPFVFFEWNTRQSESKALFSTFRLLHFPTMTVYARVASTAGRTAARAQRRQMGGSHAPAPEWTGIDKVVRGYFPEDYQREYLHRGPFGERRRVEAGTSARTRPTD